MVIEDVGYVVTPSWFLAAFFSSLFLMRESDFLKLNNMFSGLPILLYKYQRNKYLNGFFPDLTF